MHVVTDAPPVLLRRSADGALVQLMLNRPERRNALTGPLASMLADTLEAVNEDKAVKVVIIQGAGGAFCSGLDLKEFSQEPQPDWVATFGAEWRRVHIAIFNSPKIIVGALERAAVNGGAGLAMACDFLVVGDGSFLQVGEIHLGMAAPMNMAWLTLRHSEAVAARISLVGDRITGPELVRLGVAYAAVPDDGVVAAAEALAEEMAAHEADGVLRIKRSLRGMRFDGTAEEWFDRTTAVDPMPGAKLQPRSMK